jgi:hypothetical protein
MLMRWIFGLLALLFTSAGTLGAVVITELHREAGGQALPTVSYASLWLGEAALFAAAGVFLYLAIKPRSSG